MLLWLSTMNGNSKTEESSMGAKEDAFREAHRRQEEYARAEREARQWEGIRSDARRNGDTTMSDEALRNLNYVHGLDPKFWAEMRERAREKNDPGLSDLAKRKASTDRPPPGFSGFSF